MVKKFVSIIFTTNCIHWMFHFAMQPLRNLLSSVGGTSVMLGLVAMATSVDALYASMKALVCIVGNNQTALKEMERTGGFQVTFGEWSKPT